VRFSAPLIPARFLERRKRFLARVELPDGRRIWVHVPNSGTQGRQALAHEAIGIRLEV